MQFVRGFDFGGHGSITFFQLVVIQGIGNTGEQLLRFEGLLQIVVGAKAQDWRDRVQGGFAGQYDRFNIGVCCGQLLQKFRACSDRE